MSMVIRAEISERNKYWIDKHRHYELKHFCLQYPSWRKIYELLGDRGVSSSKLDYTPTTNTPGDKTGNTAIERAEYFKKMNMIEKAAMEADEDLYIYILKAVTEGLSYTYLKAKLEIPCGKDLYYDRYRRFFWLLNKSRG